MTPLELLVPPQEIPVLRLGQVVLRLLLPVVSLLRLSLLVLLLEVLVQRLDQVLLLLLLPMAIWKPVHWQLVQLLLNRAKLGRAPCLFT